MDILSVDLFTDEKNGKTVWESKSGKLKSKALYIKGEALDLTTGILNEPQFLYWVKAGTEEAVDRTINKVKAKIEKGIILPYRALSKTPFHAKDTPVINPDTGTEMGYYSQVRLGPASKFDELHRQFVEPTYNPEAEADPVVNKKVDQTT